MDRLLQDLRYALRQLRRNPAFSVLAVLTLALGIGANTAIFSVVNGVLLRPLPYPESERLVMLYTGYPDDETRYPLSAPDFMSYHDEARTFSGVVAAASGRQALTGRAEPAWVQVGRVSADFFEVMGTVPVLGRTFRPEENQPGTDGVVVLTHAWWQARLGADPEVLGQVLTLDGIPREIVGVLPPEFDFPSARELYTPLSYGDTFNSNTAQGRRSEYLVAVARMAPGVGPGEAAAEVAAINQRLQAEFPVTNSENITISLVPLRDHLLGDVRGPVLVLLGAVGLVLLIACVNVANLLLARASARRQELAVRSALGAGRGRVVRQLLTESVVLGVLGGAAGLLLAAWGVPLLAATAPDGIPRLASIRIDGAVVAFAVAISLGTGVLFGLVPSFQISRWRPSAVLRDGGPGAAGGRSGNRARRALVVTEMALAVMLLVGSGLLIRSFLALTSVDPGFHTDGVVAFSVSLPPSSYQDGSSIRQFFPTLLNRIRTLPGVEEASAGSEVPLGGVGSIFGFSIENREPPAPGFVMDAATVSVAPAYFAALGIPLRAGRLLDERDRFEAPEALVVNEAFVARYFPEEDPLGQRLSFGAEDEWWEIVGVVGDVPQFGLDDNVRPAVYASHAQFTTRSLFVVVRSPGDPLALTGALRAELRALDPSLPILRFVTGEQLVAESVATTRFYTTLLAIFAAVALTLAAVGIFGVISYIVTQRTREFGIRLAVGARPGDVLRMIIGQGAGMAVFGIVVGLLAAAVVTRVLAGMLYGVGTLDPIAFGSVALVLLGVAILATWLPARRAIKTDPVIALRAQ